jgi:hypothetical protein
VNNNKEYYDFRVKNDKELKKANGGMKQKAENSVFVYLLHPSQNISKNSKNKQSKMLLAMAMDCFFLRKIQINITTSE